MSQQIRDILARRAVDQFVGRRAELARLMESLEPAGPVVTHVHGLAGVGKSALLQVYAAQAEARGVAVVRLDARLFEPTAAGFLEELATTLGTRAEELGQAAAQVALVVDGYELLRVLDSWFRQVFVPSLGENVRVVVASRQPPGIPWLVEGQWQGLFRSIHLETLVAADALELLARRGYTEAEALALNRVAQGHPLALSLASHLMAGRATESTPMRATGMLERLAQLYLSDATPPVRAAIEAAAILRRVTQPALAALFPGADAAGLWEELSRVSFFETTREGLVLHDAVRQAVASSLRARDPGLYGSYRRTIGQHLLGEAVKASAGQRSRVLFDLVFLLEHPGVREAFFPTSAPPFSIEPARPADRAAIFAIVERHEGPAAGQALGWWWEHFPQAFRVARDETGVAGFCVCLEAEQVTPELRRADAIVNGWAQHLSERPLAPGQKAILVRRWLSEREGEGPSGVQAECWLDVKRTYLELKASLRRCYISVADLTPFAAAAQYLGFQPVPEATASFDGSPQHLAVLDFGPGALDGWVRGLLSRELDFPHGELLDRQTRQVCVDGGRVDLTSLEFGVLGLLQEHEGKAVSRDQLLREVWGQSFDCGSNVVDAVVSSLRQKLGSQAGRLATVRGVGYRLAGSPG